MPDDVTITKADKMLAYVEITSTQLLEQLKQFDGLVVDPKLRAELAGNLADLSFALHAVRQSLVVPVGRRDRRAWVQLSIHQRKTQPHPQLQ